MSTFFSFPRTSHLLNLGSASQDDLVYAELDLKEFFTSSASKIVTFEEKIDGGNMGFCMDEKNEKILAQNRSKYVTSRFHPQYARLDKFIFRHKEELEDVLMGNGKRYLFGEWLAAKHSIYYTNLPDYFIAYDIYDVDRQKFLDRASFYQIMSTTSIHFLKPLVNDPESYNTKEKLIMFLQNKRSEFSDSLIEGIYIRIDQDGYLKDRAKIVRGDFVCGNEEWSKHHITPNIVNSS